MDYGTYQIDLYRIWNVKAQSYVRGITGSITHVRMQFHDWLCNEFCDGFNVREIDNDPTIPADVRQAVHKAYQHARANYRIVKVQVRVGEDISGNMTVVINGRNN